MRPGTDAAFAPGLTVQGSKASMPVLMGFAGMARVFMVMRPVIARMLVVMAVRSVPVVVGMLVLVDMAVGMGVRMFVAVLAQVRMFVLMLMFVGVLMGMLMTVLMVAFHGNLLFPDRIAIPDLLYSRHDNSFCCTAHAPAKAHWRNRRNKLPAVAQTAQKAFSSDKNFACADRAYFFRSNRIGSMTQAATSRPLNRAGRNFHLPRAARTD